MTQLHRITDILKPLHGCLPTQAEHGRRYASVQEERYRLSVFEQNQQFIDDHNARFENGEVTFTLQMNQFGDMVSMVISARTCLWLKESDIRFNDCRPFPSAF